MSLGSSAIALFLFAFVIIPMECQFAEKLTAQNPCVSKVSCRECIQTKSCAWCLQPDFGDKPRCFQPSLSSFTGGCPEQYTWNPDHEERLLIREELTRAGSSSAAAGAAYGGSSSYGSSSSSGSFSSSSSSGSSSSSHHHFGSASGQKIVQIYPQRVGLKLRISKLKNVPS